MSKQLSSQRIRELVEQWVSHEHKRLVESYRLSRFEGRQSEDAEWFQPYARDDEEAIEVANWVGPGDFARDDLRLIEQSRNPGEARNHYEKWLGAASEAARAVGIELPSLPPLERSTWVREFLRGLSRLQDRVNSPLAEPSPIGETAKAEPSADVANPTFGQSKPVSVSLSDAWERYCAEQKSAGATDWANGAPKHALWAWQDLQELFGSEIPIEQIGRTELLRYRDILQTRYPANRNVKARFRNKTLAELAAGPELDPHLRISDGTKSSRLSHIRRFFRFQVDHGMRDSDPSSVAKIKAKPTGKGKAWTEQEIQRILLSEDLHQQFLLPSEHHCPGGMFWLVAVLAYTGARQMEIMGLRFDDFDLAPPHPVLHIRPHEDRSVKTERSERWVPIHDDLIALGLADWLSQRQLQGAQTPWPQGKVAGRYWSRRFREAVTERLGLHEHRTKNLHSFRHTFVSTAVSFGIPEETRRLITGHKGQGIDWDHYIHQVGSSREKFSHQLNTLTYGLDIPRVRALWQSVIKEAACGA